MRISLSLLSSILIRFSSQLLVNTAAAPCRSHARGRDFPDISHTFTALTS